MKATVAVILVVVSLAAAESPRYRGSARQTAPPGAFQPPAASAPYNPRGWRPQGAAFTLPKSQLQQVYGPPAPKPSYGPPHEPTTTEGIAESTEPPQRFQAAQVNSKGSSNAAVAAEKPQAAYYVVLPQSSAVVVPQPQSAAVVVAQPQVYTMQKGAPLVTVSQAAFVAAAPLTTAPLQAVPVSTYKALYPPLTAPYVQVDW